MPQKDAARTSSAAGARCSVSWAGGGGGKTRDRTGKQPGLAYSGMQDHATVRFDLRDTSSLRVAAVYQSLNVGFCCNVFWGGRVGGGECGDLSVCPLPHSPPDRSTSVLIHSKGFLWTLVSNQHASSRFSLEHLSFRCLSRETKRNNSWSRFFDQ